MSEGQSWTLLQPSGMNENDGPSDGARPVIIIVSTIQFKLAPLTAP